MLKPAVPVGHIFFGFLFFTAASFICAHKIENRCKLYHVCGLMKNVIKKISHCIRIVLLSLSLVSPILAYREDRMSLVGCCFP